MYAQRTTRIHFVIAVPRRCTTPPCLRGLSTCRNSKQIYSNRTKRSTGFGFKTWPVWQGETAPDWYSIRAIEDANACFIGEKLVSSAFCLPIPILKNEPLSPLVSESIAIIVSSHDLEVWVDDNKTKSHRIPDVFDCWVESGSMPYASIHYPFENKEKFEASYPAQFITEYIAQTRAWFYTLHVMSVGIFGKPAFQNALTTGTLMAADGSKMSKSKKNYPDPMVVINKFGVDSLRLSLMSSVVMKADNSNFDETVLTKFERSIGIWWNVFAFYKLYGDQTKPLILPTKIARYGSMDCVSNNACYSSDLIMVHTMW